MILRLNWHPWLASRSSSNALVHLTYAITSYLCAYNRGIIIQHNPLKLLLHEVSGFNSKKGNNRTLTSPIMLLRMSLRDYQTITIHSYHLIAWNKLLMLELHWFYNKVLHWSSHITEQHRNFIHMVGGSYGANGANGFSISVTVNCNQ